VVSRAQLTAMGLGRGAIDKRLGAGRLRRIHRGVYAIGGAALPREGRQLAAVLACGDGAVLSHVSAADHWGLLTSEPAQPHVTAPASRAGAPGIRLHRTRFLDARDGTTHRGIPITTLARTLLDLAATAPRNHLVYAIGLAIRNHLYDHRAIRDVLERHRGRRGTRALRTATADDPAFTRSELERRFRALCRRAGLSQPLSNVVVAEQTTTLTRSTSTSRPTASSSRPTAGATTGLGRLRARPGQGRRPRRRGPPGAALHQASDRRRPGHRRRARQSGMLPCFRFGACTRLVSSVSSAEMTFGRVSCGTITSST
jgi:hypothetical protein